VATVTAAPVAEPMAQKEVDLLWAVKVPLRDGVRLNATVYRPAVMKGPLPAIFTLTPYIADSYHERAMYFARHDYVFVLVDVRGRGNSEGRFEPFANEARNGHDVVEWMARQEWCNGKVAMWGGSYAGFDQWATLKESPPHLATIVPAAAAHPGVDFPAFKNIYPSYLMQWLTFTAGVTPNSKLFGEDEFWVSKFRRLYLEHRPFQDLDLVVGSRNAHFQKWLEHPTPDSYFDEMVPSAEDYRRIELPILTITGQYDGDQAGAMAYYQRHMRSGSPNSRNHHYLIVGPWDHAGTRTPTRNVGGIRFGAASMLDLNDLHRQWYDWTLKGGQKPDFLKKRVAYYVTGAEVWKYADSLEEVPTRPVKFYLNSAGGHAGDAFHSGSLGRDRPDKSQPDHYVYDPLDTRPVEFRQEEETAVIDQRQVLALQGNGLVYHTEPFPEPTEITGYVKLRVWIALDVRDTDFEVLLAEVQPNGTSVLLSSDMLRARYRESLRKETLVEPGTINCYEFNAFTYFSRQLAKGSRLRLVVHSPNSIYLEKNYNSGGVVSKESKKDARTAHVTLYHDAEHPSSLEVPLILPRKK
jgi:putative CocE/NonD family hydrolase